MSSEKYFEQVANQWDHMRQGFYTEALRSRAIQSARVRPGTIAVDLGAGTGFITEGLVAAGVRVIALDRSEAMLAELKKKFAHSGCVDARIAEANRLPLQDASADYVFANMLLHHVEDPPGTIREMARVLKPGGRVVITDLDEHSDTAMKERHHDRWMGFKRKNVSEWLGQAGLTDIGVACSGERCCDDTTQIGIFIASAQKKARPSVPPGPIVTLCYRTSYERRQELLDFLRRAFPFYERHGGSRMALYESIEEPGFFLELVAYESDSDYVADQERVEHDPATRRVLQEWKAFVSGPVEVRQFRPVPLDTPGCTP